MDGRLSMAVDEALSAAVGERKCPQTVRLYGFSPPTLSLGRFQPVKDRLDLGLLAGDRVVLVRRPTGGHAVLHDEELTYSIAVSKAWMEETSGPFRKRAFYDYVARILLSGLSLLGVRGRVNAAQEGDIRNPDCFGSSGEYEIVDEEGRKLIGSAQMTTRLAVLQQGSIPLSNPAGRVSRYIGGEAQGGAREPSCLREAVSGRIDFEEARDAFARAFREGLGAGDSTLSAAEEEAAGRLLESKYGTEEWNLRA
jgi:lipoate-protein ligase A